MRRVWLWFRAEQLTFPLRVHYGPIHWVPPSYDAIHQVLTNPAYAGAYTYGQSQQERYVDEKASFASAYVNCRARSGQC